MCFFTKQILYKKTGSTILNQIRVALLLLLVSVGDLSIVTQLVSKWRLLNILNIEIPLKMTTLPPKK